MPLYEYRCQSCGPHTEVMQRFSDPPLATCDECGGELKKLLSAPAFQFKGTGWYVTDFRDNDKKKKDAKEGAEGESKGSGDAKSDSKAAEGSKTKSEDKQEKKADSSSKSTKGSNSAANA